MPPQKKKPTGESRNGPRNDSLDKVREILLGEERRNRIAHDSKLEKETGKQIKVLRKDLDAGLEDVEVRLAEKIDALHELLVEEQAARRKQQAALSKRITKLSETVDEKLSTIRRRITKSSSDLRGQLHTECAELRVDVDAELAEIRDTKTDRSSLSGLLSDLAKKVDKKGS